MPPLRTHQAPPKRIVLLAGVFLLAAILVCMAVLWHTPWLGIRFTPGPTGDLLAASVTGSARAAGLQPGPVVALHNALGERLTLEANDILEEPDFHNDYADYNVFMARQTRISAALNEETVGLETSGGKVTWVKPGRRPPEDLPLIFWFQIVCGGIAWMVGSAVIAYSRQPGAGFYAITGAAFMAITYTAAIYSGRELALDGSLFRALSVANHAGAFVFAPAFIALLWYYPSRLGDSRLPWLLFGCYFLVWLSDTLQELPNMNFGIRYPMLVGLAASFILAGLQWRKARFEPINRAALKWFLMTLTIGSAVFVLGVFGMQALGHLPVIPQGFAFGFVLMMYLGMAIGMKRYRLFNLEPWWPEVWVWFLGGVMVLMIDLLLIQLVISDHGLSLALSLAIAGWLYFPLRQHILKRAIRDNDVRLSEMMPELIDISSAPPGPDQARSRWQKLLQNAFQPQAMLATESPLTETHIVDDGLCLAVPQLDGRGSLLLTHAAGGKRLFLPSDSRFTQAILGLLRQALTRQEAYARGALETRLNIAQDLHDDIGAKLLTLIHTTESETGAQGLRGILQDLRSLAASLHSDPAPLNEAVADWRSEIAHRCEIAQVKFVWEDRLSDNNLILHPRSRLALEQTLREAVTNALKHANPDQISITLDEQDDLLCISVCDDGSGPAAETWQPGLGLRNMRNRLAGIKGSVEFKTLNPSGTRVHIQAHQTSLMARA